MFVFGGRGLPRFVAPVIVALTCASWVAAAVHEGQPHRYCERHRTLEEGSGGAGVAAEPSIQAAAGSAHASCGLLGHHPDVSRIVAPAAADAIGVPAAAVAIDQSDKFPIPLLANAPKSSPPRVA